jgi:hypothetical protein
VDTVRLRRLGGSRPGLSSQGHILRVGDLLSTLVVEAAMHHLDLVVGLDRPGPGELAVEHISSALTGLLGHPAPVGIDRARWILIATGRSRPTDLERTTLGPDAALLPLLH